MAMKKELNDLNTLLATTAVFAQKTHNLHWNLQGSGFKEIHEMTDTVYETLNNFIDDMAEKIIQQGGVPFVTLSEYIKASKIKETTKANFTTKQVIELMYKDLDTYAKLASSVKTNEFTQPLLDEVLMFADKNRWFFKASK